MNNVDYLQKLHKDQRLQDIEWGNCFDDPYYFLTNWAYTLDVHDPENPIKVFPDKEYIKIITKIWLNNPLLLIPKSRQMMMTWIFVCLYLWDTQFHKGKLTFFQSKKEDDADDLIKRAKFIWDHEPKFLKRTYERKQFFPLECNPQHKGQHVYCKMTFPSINSEIRGIPQGGDVIRMHTASGILCLSSKTKVLTFDLRWVTVDSVKEGDILAGFDENIGDAGFKSNGVGVARQWRNSKVEQVVELIRPCYELIFSDGTKIICSQEHPWLAGYGQKYVWIQAKDLKVKKGNGFGSKIVKFIDVWNENNFKDYISGYLAAIYDGEGQIRPIRLLEKMNLDLWGTALAKEGVELISRKFIGNKKVIGFKTSTKTFVVEGLASHNSDEMGFQPEAKAAYTAAKPTLSAKGRFTGVSTAEDNSFFEQLVFDKIEV